MVMLHQQLGTLKYITKPCRIYSLCWNDTQQSQLTYVYPTILYLLWLCESLSLCGVRDLFVSYRQVLLSSPCLWTFSFTYASSMNLLYAIHEKSQSWQTNHSYPQVKKRKSDFDVEWMCWLTSVQFVMKRHHLISKTE